MRYLLPTMTLMLSTFASAAEIDIVARQQRGQALQRMEWEIRLPRTYQNPFDPAEISVDVHFTSPQKQTLVLPAFWTQQFTENRHGHHETRRATKADEGTWLVRFCPTVPGSWSMQIRIKDQHGEMKLPAVEFDVDPAAPDARGFARRAPGNERYLQFDSNAPFFPIGLNIAWPKADTGLEDYERQFKSLADAGGNFARIWMSHPNRMTETTEAGIGRFDLSAMQYYDELFALAEKHGIYLMVCFNNHRDLLPRDQYGEAIWGRFPYNAANGGPATRPIDFVTNEQARELYQRRLRYVIARYSAFTNVAFWEFFNEQEFTKIEVPLDWMRDMSAFMKTNDPYQHLVTTSAKIPDEQWELPDIDLTQSHLYVGGSADLVGPVVSSARRHDRFKKPHVVGELGVGEGIDTKLDRADTGTALHNGIWASAMSGAAGSSWFWWWDNYVEPKNLWHVYTGLSKFAAAVDWPKRNFQPIELAMPQIPPGSTDEFFDMTIACTENWRYVPPREIVVAPNGRLSDALPHYFVSPMQADIYAPVRLAVDLPRPTTMVLRVRRVCDVGVLRVLVDDKPLADFPFSALPGSPDVKETKPRPPEPGRPMVYEAAVPGERTVEIPAGKHVITVTNVAGDWVSLESITFKEGQSSQHQLATLALADPSAGETIAWIYDTRSHWQSDRDGLEPRRFDGVRLTIPTARRGPMRVQWWDTRRGTVAEQEATATGNSLELPVPEFTRDIALRVFPVAQR